MPVPVVIQQVLLETDVPDLVLAIDAVGTQYLCCLVARGEEGDQFFAVAISAPRLSRFRAGQVDLRTVLTEPEVGSSYSGFFVRQNNQPIINLEAVAEVPEQWLPERGFLLTILTGTHDESDVVQRAAATGGAVVVCQLDPPEARDRHRIDADHLAEGVKGFQQLIKWAHKKRLAELPAAVRQAFAGDAYVIQATAFAQGSFEVHFESKHRADLIGSSTVGNAMSKVDELMGLAALAPDQQLVVLRQNRGHALGALRKLMKFIATEGAGLTYRWADPAMGIAAGQTVTPAAADAVSTVLEHLTELTTEQVRFLGRFIRVAEDKKTWRAVEEGSGVPRAGRVHADAPTILQGVRITEQRYEFICEERIQEKASGALVPTLFLRDLISIL